MIVQDSWILKERISQVKLALPLFAEKNSQNGLFFPFNYVNTHRLACNIYSENFFSCFSCKNAEKSSGFILRNLVISNEIIFYKFKYCTNLTF